MALEEEKPVSLMMNMPRWFVELPEEEKMELEKKIARDSDSDQPLSDEDLADLLSLSAQ